MDAVSWMDDLVDARAVTCTRHTEDARREAADRPSTRALVHAVIAELHAAEGGVVSDVRLAVNCELDHPSEVGWEVLENVCGPAR